MLIRPPILTGKFIFILDTFLKSFNRFYIKLSKCIGHVVWNFN